MGSSHRIRTLCAFGAVALAAALPASAAKAPGGTATGSQNPHLLVTLSVRVAGRSIQIVTVTGSVQNTTKSPLLVTVTGTLTGPHGNTGSNSVTSTIGGKKKVANNYAVVIKPTDPRGTYTLTLSASEGGGTSSVTLHFTIN